MDKKTNNNQNLPSGWRKVKLGEILKEPPQYGYTASATDKKMGPKFLRVTDIVGYKVDHFVKFLKKRKRSIYSIKEISSLQELVPLDTLFL